MPLIISFNSLCEIPHNITATAWPLGVLFQFSLWDSEIMLCIMPIIVTISFQFSLWDSIPKQGKMISTFISLSILFVRFRTRHDLWLRMRENFQFSLWDSGRCDRWVGFRQLAFNSLCEIQVFRGEVIWVSRILSILFVRFQKTMDKRNV